MAKIVIEITPHRGHKEHYTFDSRQITIGRGYKNDLIITDPYVSAEHAVLSYDENGWHIADISRENGIFIRRLAKNCAKADIASGDEVILGKTTLRIFSPSHQVEPVKRMVHPGRLFKKTGSHRSAWALFILAFSLYSLSAYLESPKKISAPELLLSGIAVAIGIVAGAGVWAFIGHLIKNKPRFIHQISIFSIFFLSLLLMGEAQGIAGYLTSSIFVVRVLAAVTTPLFVSLLLMANLYVATNISLQKRAIASGIIGLCICVIMFLMYFSDKNEFNARPEYFYGLKPPFIKVVPSKTVQQFIQKSSHLFIPKI